MTARTEDAWSMFLDVVTRTIEVRGSWEGEARVLREAAGIRRFGRANWAAAAAALGAADLEVDPPMQPYESDPIAIRPSGWDSWTRIGTDLLERAADVERRVPENALWRDDIVRDTALGEWIGMACRAGWCVAPPGDER